MTDKKQIRKKLYLLFRKIVENGKGSHKPMMAVYGLSDALELRKQVIDPEQPDTPENPNSKVLEIPTSMLFVPAIRYGQMTGKDPLKQKMTKSEALSEIMRYIVDLGAASSGKTVAKLDEVEIVGHIVRALTLYLYNDEVADPLTAFFYALGKAGLEPYATEFSEFYTDEKKSTNP